MLSPTLESLFLKCIQICVHFISWFYHIIFACYTRIQPSQAFPVFLLLIIYIYIYRHFNKKKQHRVDSVPLSHCHGDKTNTVKSGFQQRWNAWLRIHFRNISLTFHSPLLRCFGALSPASPQARMEKDWLSPGREAWQLQWRSHCLQSEFLLQVPGARKTSGLCVWNPPCGLGYSLYRLAPLLTLWRSCLATVQALGSLWY